MIQVWWKKVLSCGNQKKSKTVNKHFCYHRKGLRSTQCGRCVFAGNPTLTEKSCGVSHPGIFWYCGLLQIFLHLSSHYQLVFTQQNSSQSPLSFFNHPGQQAESLCNPLMMNLMNILLPEIDYCCFHFDKVWQRHLVPLWLNHKRQTELVLAELVLTLKWLNSDFIQEPSSLPLPPKTSQQLFEDLCDSSERTQCWG